MIWTDLPSIIVIYHMLSMLCIICICQLYLAFMLTNKLNERDLGYKIMSDFTWNKSLVG